MTYLYKVKARMNGWDVVRFSYNKAGQEIDDKRHSSWVVLKNAEENAERLNAELAPQKRHTVAERN
jgi:hypothetical protein